MARRRDPVSRLTERLTSEYTPNQKAKLARVGKGRYGEPDSTSRLRGRRGVRARARAQRIAMRQANGTYTQPSGGTTTNS